MTQPLDYAGPGTNRPAGPTPPVPGRPRVGCGVTLLVVGLIACGAVFLSASRERAEIRQAASNVVGGFGPGDEFGRYRAAGWGDGSSVYELRLSPSTFDRVLADAAAGRRGVAPADRPRVSPPEWAAGGPRVEYHFEDRSYVFFPASRTLLVLEGYP